MDDYSFFNSIFDDTKEKVNKYKIYLFFFVSITVLQSATKQKL